jgi:formamidopyrimidine-DNA glycosylase
MPEGPEVRWMIDNINQTIINKKTQLLKVQIISGRYKTHGYPANYQIFNNLLEKETVYLQPIQSKGKFIYLTMSNLPWNIWITLGLSGHLLINELKTNNSHSEMNPDYIRIVFETNNGIFYLYDMRNFGTITFTPTIEALTKKLSKIGPDILNETESITPNEFVEIMHKGNQDKLISTVLIEQNKISGIGNYLRSEILYESKISPFRKLKDLDTVELKHIFQKSKDILKKSYLSQSNNGLHSYTFQVYMQDKDPHGNIIKSDKLPDKRTIWWVPSLQK